MKTLNEMLENQMQDEKFRKEYEEMQPEFDVIRAIVDARTSQNLTQKELSERTGINQADISKLENGTRNPSVSLLKRLAEGMGMVLKIEFIPKQKVATVYKGNIIKNLIMDCQSYTKYRPNETTGGIFVSWRRKEELPTGA